MNIKKNRGVLFQDNVYEHHIIRKKFIIIVLLAVTIVAFFWAINAGAMPIKPKKVILAILGLGDNKSISIIRNIRMPRVVSGILAGAGLSIAGCIMQNNLKNPLASPSTLGISNAAAFGANVAIILLGAGTIVSTGLGEIQIFNPYIVTICAMSFSIGSTLLIISLSKIGRFSTQSIILAGVALSSLFSAGTMIIQYFSGDTTKVAAVIFWTFGDLGRASWNEIIIMGILIAISIIYFIYHRWDYNALDSGDDTAKSLGVNVERIRLCGMFMASVITAVTVSFLGIIGFIGLICPQITKRLIGSDNRYLIPASAIMGSFILLISDTLARVLLSPQTLPVGAVTSFLGAPLFLYFLIKGM
ncbi:FecCD family ABC transporter permease [Anaerosalibacter massiliensis]|uniref:FecCD family ABC transporter permease n=1 Tax=Anaerosalibacter massiliensis TaxID=1347392 RepID=UPI000ABB0D22|nr:iron ABC transporter permease [Anaerosalibacter massiliensis]